jgi:glycerol-3-phosphate O-acyltransferase
VVAVVSALGPGVGAAGVSSDAMATIVGSERFEERVRSLAAKTGQSPSDVRDEAVASLKEMAAGESQVAVQALTRVGHWLSRAYRVEADTASLRRLRRLNETTPLVFLPNHRSYLDPFVLRSVLAPAGFPPNHVLGGVNLAFFPMGAIARRSNIVFIRRQFRDAPVYRAMLGEYLAHLVSTGANLEWYIEGGRTRTGKLRPPRMGILSYLVDAFDDSGVEDLLFVPVSVIYDQQHEVGLIAVEESGGVKPPESVRWLVDYARAQGSRRGSAHVRFAEPVSLRAALAEARAAAGSPDVRQAVPRVAFEVCHRINQVTPITATALATLALLDNDDRAMTEAQMRESLLPVVEYIRDRGLPMAAGLDLTKIEVLTERSPAEGRRALDTLVREGVVTEYTGGLEPVYVIPPDRQLEAAFYRNTLSHFFVTRSITEVALVRAVEERAPDLPAAVWTEALRLRDLLKYEYFFSSKREFDAEVRLEAELAYPGWDSAGLSTDEVLPALAASRFLLAHRIIAPFLEAYAVLADRLAAANPSAPVDEDALVAEAIGVARQRVLQRTIHSPESVSKDLFRNALLLAGNRGLLDPDGENLVERRADFAAELADAVRRVGVLRALAAGTEA